MVSFGVSDGQMTREGRPCVRLHGGCSARGDQGRWPCVGGVISSSDPDLIYRRDLYKNSMKAGN